MRKRRLLAGLKPLPEKVALPVAKSFTGPGMVSEQDQAGSLTSTNDGSTIRRYDRDGNLRVQVGILTNDSPTPWSSDLTPPAPTGPFGDLARARIIIDPVADDWRIYAFEESRDVSYTDVMRVDGRVSRVATASKGTCKFTVRDRAHGSTGSPFRVSDLMSVLVGDHALRIEGRLWKVQSVERYSRGVYDFYCDEIVLQRS